MSYRVDLCHQTNDEDEEDVRSHREALLDRTKTKPGIPPVNIRQRCCPGIQLGSRQKFVILASFLSHHCNLLVSLSWPFSHSCRSSYSLFIYLFMHDDALVMEIIWFIIFNHSLLLVVLFIRVTIY